MNKIELLAPVGSKEAFLSAINNGANAIYLAGEHFGAREKATFSNDELKEMIKYAHVREVRVHVVINTLIYDDELEQVIKFVDFLYNNDVDAIIVQDLGIITLIHNMYPDLEIHASTQLNTMTVKQAKILKDLGVSRVILARETSLQDAIKIKNEVGVDVEVFGHGALCMGYSGECLFSSLAAKKSGNRGECLQLCRLPYKLMNNKEQIDTKEDRYLLSCKDLCTLEYLDKIIDAGITSIKIEGRVKSATYVGKVISTYRKYIDKYYIDHNLNVDNSDLIDLKKVFNRGFTKGYLFNETSRDISNEFRPNNIGIQIGEVININKNKVSIKLINDLHQGDGIRIISNEDVGLFVNRLYLKGLLVNKAKKGDVISLDIYSKVQLKDKVYKTSDVLLNKEIEDNNRIIVNRYPIKVLIKAKVGENLQITAIDDLDNKINLASDYIVDKANKTPTSKERIKEQISKLTESTYYLDDIKIDSDEMIIIPISVINKLRNNMVKELNSLREINHKNRLGKQELKLKNIKLKNDEFKFMYKANNYMQYKTIESMSKTDQIYYKNSECIYSYPRISSNIIKPNNKSILVNELSDIDKDKETICNAYLNTTNIFSLYTLYLLGASRVCLSVEMNLNRIENLIKNYKIMFNQAPNIEVIVYGKLDLMITKHCPINKYLSSKDKDCGKCEENRYYLMDRKGYRLDLINDGLCNVRILNPKKLHLIEYVDKLKKIGVNRLQLDFTIENKDEIIEVIDGYNKGKINLLGVTNGYFE